MLSACCVIHAASQIALFWLLVHFSHLLMGMACAGVTPKEGRLNQNCKYFSYPAIFLRFWQSFESESIDNFKALFL